MKTNENKTLMKKFEVMKAMNLIIKSMNDEIPYFDDWIYLIPDEADDYDLIMCAKNEEIFKDACILFRALIKDYGKSGFCIGEEVY